MLKPYLKLIHSYRTLGLRVGLSHALIKKAYRSLIKEWHPDLHQQDPAGAEEQAKEINAAFSQLKAASASELKAVQVFYQSSRPRHRPPPRRAQGRAPRPAPPQPPRRDRRPPQARPRPQAPPAAAPSRFNRRGRDVIGGVEISAEEQRSGAHWKLVLETCNRCAGWGAAIHTKLVICPACNGLGFQRSPVVTGWRSVSICGRCDGHGCHFKKRCAACSGTGSGTVYTAKFSVPAGIGRDYLGFIDGLGHPAVGNGKPGDLYLLVVPGR